MADLAALQVQLELQTARFDERMRGVERSLGRMNRTTSKVSQGFKALGVALAGAFSARAFVRGISDTIRAMDELAKSSQALGVTTEELSAFQYQAKLTGVSSSELETGIRQLSRGMLELTQGRSTEATRALENLGVSVTDAAGAMRSTQDVIADMADTFKDMPDGAEKTALAMQVFGRSGAAMVPMLNQGAESLQEMTDELDRFGGLVDRKSAAAAEQFRDQLTRMQTAAAGVGIQIAQSMLPSLTAITDEMLNAAETGEVFARAGMRVGQVLETLIPAFNIGSQVLGLFTDSFQHYYRQSGSVLERFENIKGAFADLAEIWGRDIDDALDDLRRRLEEGGRYSDVASPIILLSEDRLEKLRRQAEQLERTLRTPMEILREEQAVAMELYTTYDAMGDSLISHETYVRAMTAAMERYKQATEGVDEATERFADAMAKLGSQIDAALTNSFDAMIDSIDGARVNFARFAAEFARDIAKMIVRIKIVEPMVRRLRESLEGSGSNSGILGALFGNAHGNAFAAGTGLGQGIYTRPTFFPMRGPSMAFAHGGVFGLGMLGEAGPEAIVPLRRTSSGDLGVKASPVVVNVNNHAPVEVDAQPRQLEDGTQVIDVMVRERVKESLTDGSMDRVLAATYGIRRRGR